MNERKRNLIVGLTTLVGIIGLAGLLMLFGYVPQFLQEGYEIRIELPRAAGLHEGSLVRFAGIDIGRVEDVRLQAPPDFGVIVTAQIEPEVAIPRAAGVSVMQPLIGGSSSLEFVLDRPLSADPEPLPRDGTAVIEGEIPDLASTLSRELRGAIEGPAANLDQLTEQFTQLSNEWAEVGRNINLLLEQRDVAAVDAGDAVGNVATVVARLDQRLAEMREVLAGIDAYVNDTELREDVRQTAANARELTGKVNRSVEDVTQRVVALSDSLAQTSEILRGVVAQAGQPDGTLGKMLADPALYNNLNDAAQRLQRAIDDVRLLVQKWRAEGLPVQF